MRKRNQFIAIWPLNMLLNVAVTVFATVGCVISWQYHGIGMLQFYTVDSNLLGGAACAINTYFLIRQRINGKSVPIWARILKYTAVCCLMVTFLVVLLVLAPTVGGQEGYRVMFTQRDMLYHHLLCPLLILFSFLLFDRMPVKTLRAAAYAMIPTGLYAAVAIVLNLTGVMDGPYPFLHVYEQPIWASCLWFTVILGGAFLITLLFCALSKRLHGKTVEETAL